MKHLGEFSRIRPTRLLVSGRSRFWRSFWIVRCRTSVYRRIGIVPPSRA